MPLLEYQLQQKDATEKIPQLTQQARDLICEAVRDYNEYYGTGTMSCAIYDTAWVALIARTENNEKRWLFPESFQFLIDNQTEDGDWGVEMCASESDSILNTASALLALKRHYAEPLQINSIEPSELQSRIDKATVSLERKLNEWDVSASTHVGFEIIIPALLRLLETTHSINSCENGKLYQFLFNGRTELMELNAKKLSRFRPEFLYSKHQSTALHSLEALMDRIDFDRVAHHKVLGSMMASPSSTAAYLMNTSTWDQEAEDYIRHVVYKGPGKGTGAVPSAYPSTNFEFSWILSTLLASGFISTDLQCPEASLMIQALRQSVLKEEGVIGFAPHLQPDADDTAKAIFVLGQILDKDEQISVNGMITTFETDSHFRTYTAERDPSFSANCNVLISLLHVGDPRQAMEQIVKVTRFLCDTWWYNYGKIKDKWNLCHIYPTMLMVEAFSRLLTLIDEEALATDAFGDETITRASIVLFQGCFRTLVQQGPDGSWESSREASSYAALILRQAQKICFLQSLRPQINEAMDLLRKYLESARDTSPEYLWIEKVTYMSPLLSKTYYLAALKACDDTIFSRQPDLIGHRLRIQYDSTILKQYTKVIQKTPLFSPIPDWQIRGSAIEAALFEPLLRQRRHEIFTRENMEEDKYFAMIPLTWTACNNRAGMPASCAFMFDMMFLSVLNFQVDEFMESVAGPAFEPHFDELKSLIDDVFSGYTCNGIANGSYTPIIQTPNGQLPSPTIHDEVRRPLERYIKHLLQHDAVQQASSRDVHALRQELKRFLHAHVTQAADNARFAKNTHQPFEDPNGNFFRWVHTTSADHTSCPSAFAFVSCLISFSFSPSSRNSSATPTTPANSTVSNKQPDAWPIAEQKYLAADLCRHLSTMCRMYNDYGSILRDQKEANLNSVNFSEFANTDAGGVGEESAKAALFRLAEYERHSVEHAFAQLVDVSVKAGNNAAVRNRTASQMGVWRLFVDVTDLYGQIYVVRDIASRMK